MSVGDIIRKLWSVLVTLSSERAGRAGKGCCQTELQLEGAVLPEQAVGWARVPGPAGG